MAGNKISTKKKDEKVKSRNNDQTIEESEDIDFSLLRKPILTSVTGFSQARKIFDLATEELKGLLSNECDLLYECKVCRNMFRSLANFISHKRVYCKEKFNTSSHGHFLKESSIVDEVMKIRKLEESYQESLNVNIESNSKDDDDDDDTRIPFTKDLTSILEEITKKRGVHQSEMDKQLVFQKIPKSSVAVYQNFESTERTDNMRAQVSEIDDILSQENAILQSDGTFIVQGDDKDIQDTENVIQISDDDDFCDYTKDDLLKCRICELQFSTLKTLKFHIKYKHLENRLVYPCPDCLDIFSTAWSVYRHLFKVHRRTAAQIRRLRESIQGKAFRMNNPPAYYEKRKVIPKTIPAQKITEEERLYKENQAWLEELDGEGEGRRCGGCGRTFERRAALAAHTHTCSRRRRRRIQIQIRKDYHKEHDNPYLPATSPAPTPADAKSNPEDVQMEEEKDMLDKDVKDDIGDDPLRITEMDILSDKSDKKDQDDMDIDVDEPVIQNPKQSFYYGSMINKLPFSQHIEKNNLNTFRLKIGSDIDVDKLLCMKCDIKHETINELLDHMAHHYKWVRYACKLCNFKHFDFDKLPEHVKIVHKLKGNTEFYYSTVKAIDGNKALELSEAVEEINEINVTSPDSRRPSRCSSDSSRISDDSSCSSTREVGSRKRKRNLYRANMKKKKNALIDGNVQKEDKVSKDGIHRESDAMPINKIFEENSSDFDEIEEKNLKRQIMEVSSSVASSRPVRKKTKTINADFEYDLSNLLKKEAQGYRDSQSINIKSVQSRKKIQQDLQNNYDIINKEYCGSMITMSRKSVEIGQAHMRLTGFPTFKSSKEAKVTSIFARPMIPKISRIDKTSPKKAEVEESNNVTSKTDKVSPKKVEVEESNVALRTDKTSPVKVSEESDNLTLIKDKISQQSQQKVAVVELNKLNSIMDKMPEKKDDVVENIKVASKTDKILEKKLGVVEMNDLITKRDKISVKKIQVIGINKVNSITDKTPAKKVEVVEINDLISKPNKISEKKVEVVEINDLTSETNEITDKKVEFLKINDLTSRTDKIMEKKGGFVKINDLTSKTNEISEKKAEFVKINDLASKTNELSEKKAEFVKLNDLTSRKNEISEKRPEFVIINDLTSRSDKMMEKKAELVEINDLTDKISENKVEVVDIDDLNSRTDKITEEKVEVADINDVSSKAIEQSSNINDSTTSKVQSTENKEGEVQIAEHNDKDVTNKSTDSQTKTVQLNLKENIVQNENTVKLDKVLIVKNDEAKLDTEKKASDSTSESSKKSLNLVPIKFRRNSLEVIKNPLLKNPLIKKNITDFTKAGLKTKILVIKPINRADGTQNLNTPLKFQAIKFKGPVKPNEEKKSDQVVVVQVPQVDGITRQTNSIISDKPTNSPLVSDKKPEDKLSNTELKNDEIQTNPTSNEVSEVIVKSNEVNKDS